MFHPWGILKKLAHIRISWVVMPDRAPGRTNGVDVIWLDKGLGQVERRCTLTHELVHIEREHDGCQSAAVEAEVCAETARRLIHLDRLVSGLRWARSFDELADELWVTPDVLRDRFRALTDEDWKILYGIELQQH